jgi:putative N-acetyltransferase (TIGR04045 family)
MFERVEPFFPAQFAVGVAGDAWQLRAARELRRRVFCGEQRLFVGSDADEHDAHAVTITATEDCAGMPHRVVGTVRIHRTAGAGNVWYGSRLAIEREYRHAYGLGPGLIRRAVGTALGHGCETFLAFVQEANVPLFTRLSWETLEVRRVYGRPHAHMRADLRAYAACDDTTPPQLIRARHAS